MTKEDRIVQGYGYRFALGAAWAGFQIYGCIMFAALILVIAYNYSGVGLDSTDDKQSGKRSNLELHTDYGTGCQYLSTKEGGIVPRLDQAGKPICGRF